MAAIEVRLEAYQGPLDLLLHLIEKNEIDITDIPIAQLTQQYMDTLHAASAYNNMEEMGDFLVMAATLLEIKSAMLLPRPKAKDGQEEAEDPREELARRLLEYKRFKSVVPFFAEGQVSHGLRLLTRPPDTDTLKRFGKAVPTAADMLQGVSLNLLFAAFDDTLKRRALRTDVVRAGFGVIAKDNFTVEDKMTAILKRLLAPKGQAGKKELAFADLFDRDATKGEMVVTFLALLELVKTDQILIKQQNLFGGIVIMAKKGGSA